MARAIWSGTVSFGLVTIPVQLHTAVRQHRPRFRLLHARDRSPVRYQRVCEKEGKPVAWEDLVKGFEYERGGFVVLTRDDFEAAALEKHRTVQILDFVDLTEIDDRYFDTPYYVTPGKGGEHAYALLREAIRGSGRIGIAKFVLREQQHLVALEAIEQALVLTTLRYADELAETSEFSFPSARDAKAKELELARSLIDSFAAEWDPSKYTDDYRDNLMRIIQAKIKGERPKLEADVEPRQAEVVDLMSRLQASLEQTGKGRKKKRAPAAGRKKRRVA